MSNEESKDVDVSGVEHSDRKKSRVKWYNYQKEGHFLVSARLRKKRPKRRKARKVKVVHTAHQQRRLPLSLRETLNPSRRPAPTGEELSSKRSCTGVAQLGSLAPDDTLLCQ